jgi:hypothetical protein
MKTNKEQYEKMSKCAHKNLDPDYSVGFVCSTPYCTGSEEHCLDCGAYLSSCGCGYENGLSDKPRSEEYYAGIHESQR